MARLSNFTCHHVHVFQEHSENILPSSEGDVRLAASSGPSVLGDKDDEECAAEDPPEISDAQNNRKRCREWLEISIIFLSARQRLFYAFLKTAIIFVFHHKLWIFFPLHVFFVRGFYFYFGLLIKHRRVLTHTRFVSGVFFWFTWHFFVHHKLFLSKSSKTLKINNFATV